MTDVAAPAVNVWDVAAITAAALAVLRLDPADADAARVGDAAVQAVEQIDQFLDQSVPINATAVQSLVGGAVDLTVSLYRRKDAGTGIAASYTPGGTAAVDTDPLAKVALMVLAWKDRFGVG